MTNSSGGTDQADDVVVPSETMLVAARVLITLAAACLAVAVAALGVMFLAWLGSGDPPYRDWPDGIAGWLVVVPALAASVTLATAALGMRNPSFWWS